jgi:uncharacterized membrane protein YqaE (UPF0057 family)
MRILHSPKEKKMKENKLLLVIISFFIPPLAVFLKEGKLTTNFWINLVLTFVLFGVGGIIHALYVVLK